MNKHQRAHPEWFDEKGRVRPWVLRALIDYDSETGRMLWKERGPEWFYAHVRGRGMIVSAEMGAERWNRAFAGTSVGRKSGDFDFKIFDKKYSAIGAAFAIVNDFWSDEKLITKDGNSRGLTNDNIEPLSINGSTRARNRAFFISGGSSPYKGVHFDKRRKLWAAKIRLEGKSKWLGFFKIEEDAADAYDRAAIKYFGPSAMTNDAVRPEQARPMIGILPSLSDEQKKRALTQTSDDDF